MVIKNKKVLLIILDGWGVNSQIKGNATLNANLPFFYNLIKNYPCTTIAAASEAVGLTEGEWGNSEVGHLNLGAGRVVWQDFAKINREIKSGSFFQNQTLNQLYNNVLKNNSKLHLVGLVSDGGIHSHINHLLALLDLAKQKKLTNVFVHMITDGRDTAPKSAEIFIKKLERKFQEIGAGKIATISGRYYAMDRDKRWLRTKKTVEAIINGKGPQVKSAKEAIELAYSKKESDEFITPTVISKNNQPIAKVENGDGIIFFNFRPDRMRQLVSEILKTNLKIEAISMTNYQKDQKLSLKFLFQKTILTNTLSEVISKAGLNQLHIAETEKYAHVTYFFNGGREKPFPNEDRILVPSPKVATYDLKPEMSANEITQKLIANLDKYSFIVVNFANPDMVGHTGNMKATIKALETIDKNLGEIIPKALLLNFSIIITADHGNAEQMIDLNGKINKEHTINPVPLILVEKNNQKKIKTKIEDFLNQTPIGVLADIAPTVLELLNLQKPHEMTGASLKNSL